MVFAHSADNIKVHFKGNHVYVHSQGDPIPYWIQYLMIYYILFYIITGSRSSESHRKTNPVGVPVAAGSAVSRYTLSRVNHNWERSTVELNKIIIMHNEMLSINWNKNKTKNKILDSRNLCPSKISICTQYIKMTS